MSVPWLERMNFCSSYSSRRRPWSRPTMRVASTYSTVPALRASSDVARVEGGAALHARADDRRVRLEQRHGLALHVGAHQGAVGVVVLEERDHRRGDGPDLLRRDVHVVDLLRRVQRVGPGLRAAQDLADEVALVVDRGVGLGDDLLLLGRRVEVVDLVGDLAVLDDPVRRRDEAVLGDLRVGGQRADQADVRALRRLDRAHAAVVGRVHVAHLDRRALAREAAGAERGQAPAVRQAGQRVRLVHELATAGEEPKNSFSAATTGRMLMIVCGVIVSASSVVRRSRTTRSIR